MSEEYAEIFREEATELLEELESALLELETTPEDLKLVGRVFRAMHTIKGSGAMFGFTEIAEFTHHVESVLDKVRNGEFAANKNLIDLILASRDYILEMLEATTTGADFDRQQGEEIIAHLKNFVAGESSPATAAPKAPEPPATAESTAVDALKFPVAVPPPADADDGKLDHYYIHFQPTPDFFENGGDFQQLKKDLDTLGSATVILDKQHDQDKPFWDLLLSTSHELNHIRDIFIFAEDTCKISITRIEPDVDATLEHRKLGEILIERGDISSDTFNAVLHKQKPKPIGEMLVDANLVSRANVESALAQQKVVQDQQKARQEKAVESVRVASDKLDHLINLVGEMVVMQARLTEVSSNHSEITALVEPVEDVERLIGELRDCVLNIRMLPIGTTFSRFKRLVRDLSSELGKDIDLATAGADTELDKSIIDQLGDPLVHLIRNSLDHGIESPQERRAAGKPAKGQIILAATHSGANVLITVTDDGRGLDADLIRQKAIEKGHIPADADLSREEIFNLIFGAGVSTARKVTAVSGRGVGMDVVKNVIEGKLRGNVKVDSELGKGTTITISLPLTLAIIDGLLVIAGTTHFVLPLSQVEECVELSAADIERFHGRRVYAIREHLVPYIRLRDFFNIPGDRPELEQMVVIQVNNDRFGLVLDNVIGGHQTVIKSLGWVYRDAEGISGATILGNGEVALMIDTVSLFKYSNSEETRLRKMQ